MKYPLRGNGRKVAKKKSPSMMLIEHNKGIALFEELQLETKEDKEEWLRKEEAYIEFARIAQGNFGNLEEELISLERRIQYLREHIQYTKLELKEGVDENCDKKTMGEALHKIFMTLR